MVEVKNESCTAEHGIVQSPRSSLGILCDFSPIPSEVEEEEDFEGEDDDAAMLLATHSTEIKTTANPLAILGGWSALT